VRKSTITFDCPNCAKRFCARDKLAGRKTKCPNCGASFRIPALVGSSAYPRNAIPKPSCDATDFWDATDRPARSRPLT
jgi:hypothetical protein